MLIAIRSIAKIETATGSTIQIIAVVRHTGIAKAVSSLEINVAAQINVRITEAVMPNVTRHAQLWINAQSTHLLAVNNYKARGETELDHRLIKPIAKYHKED